MSVHAYREEGWSTWRLLYTYHKSIFCKCVTSWIKCTFLSSMQARGGAYFTPLPPCPSLCRSQAFVPPSVYQAFELLLVALYRIGVSCMVRHKLKYIVLFIRAKLTNL